MFLVNCKIIILIIFSHTIVLKIITANPSPGITSIGALTVTLRFTSTAGSETSAAAHQISNAIPTRHCAHQ